MLKEVPAKEPRFFADCMLGRLARWMRAVGLNTLYERNIDDDDLLRRCHAEQRVLLTRDTALLQRKGVGDALLINSDETGAQLRQVMSHFSIPLRRELLFSRCTHCNCPVLEVPKEQVKGQVPPFVFRTERRFTRCPNCDKLFWRGTHRDRFLKQVFPKEMQ